MHAVVTPQELSFNPRSREGSDAGGGRSGAAKYEFQSTLP